MYFEIICCKRGIVVGYNTDVVIGAKLSFWYLHRLFIESHSSIQDSEPSIIVEIPKAKYLGIDVAITKSLSSGDFHITAFIFSSTVAHVCTVVYSLDLGNKDVRSSVISSPMNAKLARWHDSATCVICGEGVGLVLRSNTLDVLKVFNASAFLPSTISKCPLDVQFCGPEQRCVLACYENGALLVIGVTRL
jgi:hypothetical protein